MISVPFRRIAVAMICCVVTAVSHPQQPAPATPAHSQAKQPPTNQSPGNQSDDKHAIGDTGEEADEPAAPAPVSAKKDATSASELAWTMLHTAATSAKPQTRIDALSAVGTLAGLARGAQMIDTALTDSDRDVRLAAIIALAGTHDRRSIPQLHKALDDPSPEVSFAAATALWKMNDHSGENVLYGVLAGERRTHEGFVNTEMHQAGKDLHNPTLLAELGAEQGAYALLGPFGIGLDAARLMLKNGNANTARVLTADLLSSDHSERTKQEFIAATHDKDYFVRGAAARALGNFRGKAVTDTLVDAFGDKKPSVRLMAAASYLRTGNGTTPHSHPTHTKAAPPGK